MQQLMSNSTRLAVLLIDCQPKFQPPMSSTTDQKPAVEEGKDAKPKSKLKPRSVVKSTFDQAKAPVKTSRPSKHSISTKTAAANKQKPLVKAPSRGVMKLRMIAKFSKLSSADGKSKDEEEQFAEEGSQNEDEDKKNEEYSLHHQLIPALKEVSRQKLRSLRMALRKIHSSSEDGLVTINEAVQTIIDLKFNLPSRLLDILVLECKIKEEKIQHEKIISYFEKAHSLTGRDSIDAIDADEIDSGLRVQSEITDAELFKRAELQLVKSREPFDLEKFRNVLKKMDTSHSGILKKLEIEKVANEFYCPIYGSLLHSVLSKSDQTKNNDIRWPEFINFLEKVYKSVVEKDSEFLEKLKKKEIAKPLPSREMLRNKFKSIAVKAREVERQKNNSPGALSTEKESIKPSNIARKPSDDSPTEKPTVTKSQPAKNISRDKKDKKPKGKILKSKAPAVDTTPRKSGNKKVVTNTPAIPKPEIVIKPVQELFEKPKNAVELELPGFPKKLLWPSDLSLSKIELPNSKDLPTVKLKIDWVYGFRGRDVLCNLSLLSNGELAYFTGRVVVLFAFCQNTQRHYCEHSADIECLTVHTDGIVIASAQKELQVSNYKWTARIWRSDSLSTLYIFQEPLDSNPGQPIFMDFSPKKNWLLVLDDSKDHILTLWDIKGQKLASTSSSHNSVLSISFSKVDENIFVTTGHEHIMWWEFRPLIGEIQAKCVADYRGFLKARITYTCLMTNHNELITGDSNGTVYVWANGANAVTNYIKHAHENYILALCVYKSFLFTGDCKGMIKLWLFNKNLDNLGMIMLPQDEGGVRHLLVAFSSSNQPILIIGTTTNSILQLLLATGKKVLHPFENVEFGVDGLSIAISQGHYGQIGNVSQVSTNDNWFITAGRDSQICVFDADKRLGVQKTQIKGHQFTCVSWLVDDSIALGTIEGRCIILDQHEINLVESYNEIILSCGVTSIFNFPDSKKIFLGGLDGCLVTLTRNENYDPEEDGSKKWNSSIFQTPIFGIDFIQGGSLDGKYYLWVSNKFGGFVAYEIEHMKIVGNLSTIKNVPWSRQQCGIIPDVIGAWMTPLMLEEKALCGSVHQTKEILAMGTAEGKIAIYRFPCLDKEAYCHSNIASNPVTNVLFLNSGDHLISVSGQDSCITQWEII